MRKQFFLASTKEKNKQLRFFFQTNQRKRHQKRLVFHGRKYSDLLAYVCRHQP